MLRLGEINSIGEIAKLAGISRQRIYQWIEQEQIDWMARRTKRLVYLWQLHVRHGSESAPKRRSKAGMRRETDKMLAKFRCLPERLND